MDSILMSPAESAAFRSRSLLRHANHLAADAEAGAWAAVYEDLSSIARALAHVRAAAREAAELEAADARA